MSKSLTYLEMSVKIILKVEGIKLKSDLALTQPEAQAPSAMAILQSAVQQGAPIDTIERLEALAERMMAKQAEREWDDAMNRCQNQMRIIGVNATNPQTRSKYATYDKLDRALRPIYSAEMFSLSFGTADCPLADHVRVTCRVSRSGHSRDYQIDMPADGKGAKGGDVMTRTHATGAAASYGMRYLLKMIFNVAVGEDDDDGNQGAHVEEAELLERLDWIRNCETVAELQASFTQSFKWAKGVGDQNALKSLVAAKDAKKKELGK
jgi:ERF superfamily